MKDDQHPTAHETREVAAEGIYQLRWCATCGALGHWKPGPPGGFEWEYPARRTRARGIEAVTR